MSRNRADWEKSIKETKVRIGLLCHLRRRTTTATTTTTTRHSTKRAFNIEQSVTATFVIIKYGRICMCVCVCVCVYVSMYMYVCMYVCSLCMYVY